MPGRELSENEFPGGTFKDDFGQSGIHPSLSYRTKCSCGDVLLFCMKK